MAVPICAGVFALRLDRRQPATWSRSASEKQPAGRSSIPSPASSTVNSVPGPHAREARMVLGRTIWPLVESRVVSIGKTPVRLLHSESRTRRALLLDQKLHAIALHPVRRDVQLR